MGMTEDWFGKEIRSDGHALEVTGDIRDEHPVWVYVTDKTEDMSLLALDADEAGKLVLDLMSVLGYQPPAEFKEFVAESHVRMDKFRWDLGVARVRHRHAVSVFGRSYDSLDTGAQHAVNEMIAKDKKIEELERKLNDVG